MINNFLNSFNAAEQKTIYLGRKNKSIIGTLQGVSGLKLTFSLIDLDSCSFSISRLIDGEVAPLYDYIETKMLIYITDIGWYEIEVSTSSDGVVEKKEIKGLELASELSAYEVYEFEINSIDQINEDSYKKIYFYCDEDGVVANGVLGRVLPYCNGWGIGHVDDKLKLISTDNFAVIDSTDSDVYSLFTETIAEKFNVLFIFDSNTRTINSYVKDDYGASTSIYTSFENLNNSIGIEVDKTAIKTSYRINCGDETINAYLRNINLTGDNRIYDYSYYLNTKFLMDSTIDGYEAMMTFHNQVRVPNKILGKNYGIVLDCSTLMETRTPVSPVELNWLVAERTKIINIIPEIDTAISTLVSLGYNNPASPFYNTIYIPCCEVASNLSGASAELASYINWYFVLRNALINNPAIIEDGKKAIIYPDHGIDQLGTLLEENQNTLDTYLSLKWNLEPIGSEKRTKYDNALAEREKIITTKDHADAVNTSYIQVINFIEMAKDAIIEACGLGKFLTKAEQDDLQLHTFVTSFAGDSYSIVDTDGSVQYAEYADKLLEEARGELAKVCKPRLRFSATSNNLLALREFESLWSSFELGNYIMIQVNDNYLVKMKMIEYSIDYNNLKDVSIVYSDEIKDTTIMKSAQSILKQSSSVNTLVQNKSSMWNATASQNGYRLTIESTAGYMFKNGLVSTTLRATVTSNDKDVSYDVPEEQFIWTRTSEDPIADATWNETKGKGKRAVVVGNDDVQSKATFACKIMG